MIHTAASQLRLLSLAFIGLIAFSASAEKADKDKPMNISAEQMDADDKTKITTFTGSVLITKGTIVLRAERVQTKEDAQGFQSTLAFPKAGERVFFRQKREGYDEFMEGEAEGLSFDEKTDTTTLTGRAIMRRLKGAAIADESSAHVIVYNNTVETMKMQGIVSSRIDNKETSVDKSSGRVRMVLSPKNKSTDKPESAAGSGTVASGGAPTTVLKPEPALK